MVWKGVRRQRVDKKKGTLAVGSVTLLLAALIVAIANHYPPPTRADGLYSATSLLGQQSFSDSTISGQTIDFPYATALDSTHHRLFVADNFNNRVLVYNLDASNQLINHTADYVLGQTGLNLTTEHCYSYNGATASGLCNPSAVAVDSSGNRLFVVDSTNTRVLEYDISSGITNGMSATYVFGQSDFTTHSTGTSATQFSNATGVAVDSAQHRLFVSDAGNFRILEFDLTTNNDPVDEVADHVLGQPDFTTGSYTGSPSANNGRFIDVVYDNTNNKLFASDEGRVLEFDTSNLTDNEAAIHVLGQPDFTTMTRVTTQAGMNGPSGISLATGAHQLFVADQGNSRVLIFNLDASDDPTDGENAAHVLGQPDFTTGSTGVAQNKFNSPGGLAVTSDGQTAYVADTSNSRLLVFDLSGSITDGMNASAVVGQFDDYGTPLFTTNDRNNIRPSQATMNGVTSTALDPINHRLFVGDANNNRVLVYNLDANNDVTSRFAAHVLGQSDFSHAGTGTTASTLSCSGTCSLSYDAARQILFVNDAGNNRVLLFNVSPSTLADGEPAEYVFGAPDFTSAGSCATTAQDFCPSAEMAYNTTTEQLFVQDDQDYNFGRVLVFDTSTLSNYPSAVRVIGQPDFTSSETGVDATHFSEDFGGLAVDPTTNQLYLADSDNNRVLVFNSDPATMSNGEAATHVIGQSDFTSSGSTTTQNSIGFPEGVLIDPDHQLLFVTDTSSARILVFNVSSITDGENAMGVLGQPDFTNGSMPTDLNATTVASPPYMNSLMGDSYDSTTRSFYYPDQADNRVMRFTFAKITTSTLPGGAPSTQYSAGVSTVGTQGAVSFDVSAGALPPGLSLNSNTGQITGTPTTAGTYQFTLTLSDNNGNAGTYTDSRVYTLAMGTSGGGSSGQTGNSGGDAGSSITEKSTNTSSDTSNEAPVDVSASTAATSGSSAPLLNDLSGYFNGGANVAFSINTAVHFCLAGANCTNQELHTITLSAVDLLHQTATFIFASSPQSITFNVGQTRDVDVNQDGKPDIRATLSSLTATTTNLTVKSISQTTTTQPAVTHVASSKTNIQTHSSHAWLFWAITGIVLAIGLGTFWGYRLKHRSVV